MQFAVGPTRRDVQVEIARPHDACHASAVETLITLVLKVQNRGDRNERAVDLLCTMNRGEFHSSAIDLRVVVEFIGRINQGRANIYRAIAPGHDRPAFEPLTVRPEIGDLSDFAWT